MKRLENIKKTNIYKVPEGYFKELPMRVQSRISAGDRKSTFLIPHFVRYATAAVILIIGITWYFNEGQPASAGQTVDDLLATVNTESMIAYVDESELTTEDILESYELSALDADGIEESVYFTFDNDKDWEGLDEDYFFELN